MSGRGGERDRDGVGACIAVCSICIRAQYIIVAASLGAATLLSSLVPGRAAGVDPKVALAAD